MTEVRVRYAPSPTGQPHIGNVRTAFFNWLYARNNGGKFIVRMEDTDQERLVEGAYEGIFDALKWLGIDWDEGPDIGGPYSPYMQSERLKIYDANVEVLLNSGHAYKCFCTRDRLTKLRKEQTDSKADIKYDRHCLSLTSTQIKEHINSGDTYVVRYRVPSSEIVVIDDIVRGQVEWNTDFLDDFVLVKSDGYPTYHLANVIDDHAMKISHVLRAEEWLPSTPRHVLLYQSLGYEMPKFGHLPMILGPDRSKLSKRHGATSILEYRDLGYLPSAVINFMVLLGWSIDDHTEIISVEDMVASFDLKRVGKPAEVFDIDKLNWMNGMYIRSLDNNDLLVAVKNVCIDAYKGRGILLDDEILAKITPLIAPRLKNLMDAPEMIEYFFTQEIDMNKDLISTVGMDDEEIYNALFMSRQYFLESSNFNKSILEVDLRDICTRLESSPRKYFGLLRNVLTGKSATPPLFDVIEILGKNVTLLRIDAALDLFKIN